MAKTNVTLEMNGDEKRLVRALSRSEKEIDKLKGKIKEAGQASKEAAKGNDQLWGPQALGRLKSFAAGLAGAGGILIAYRLITAELRSQIALQDKAAQRQITLASARKDVIRNLPGAKTGTVENVLASITKIAGRTNVDEKFIAAGFAEALSASGGNVPASTAAVEQASRFLADKPGAIGGFAGSLLDLSKVTGTTDAQVNLGLLTQVAGLSRVVNPQQQAKNIPRSLIGQTAFGSTAGGASALFSALTTGSGDITGATSGTSAIALAQQLQQFQQGKGTFGKVPGRLRGSGATTAARIAELQADPKAATAFLDKASFERIARGPIRDLLTDVQSDVAKSFTAALQAFPSNPELAKIGQQTIQNFMVDPLERIARGQRAFSASSQQLLSSRLVDAEGSISRQGLADVLSASGLPGPVSQGIARARFEVGSGLGRNEAFGVAADILSDRRNELLNPRRPTTTQRFGDLAQMNLPPLRPSLEAQSTAALLQGLIEELREINQNTRDTAARIQPTPELVPATEDR